MCVWSWYLCYGVCLEPVCGCEPVFVASVNGCTLNAGNLTLGCVCVKLYSVETCVWFKEHISVCVCVCVYVLTLLCQHFLREMLFRHKWHTSVMFYIASICTLECKYMLVLKNVLRVRVFGR